MQLRSKSQFNSRGNTATSRGQTFWFAHSLGFGLKRAGSIVAAILLIGFLVVSRAAHGAQTAAIGVSFNPQAIEALTQSSLTLPTPQLTTTTTSDVTSQAPSATISVNGQSVTVPTSGVINKTITNGNTTSYINVSTQHTQSTSGSTSSVQSTSFSSYSTNGGTSYHSEYHSP